MRGTPPQTHLKMLGGSTTAVAFAPAGSGLSELDTHSELESISLFQSRRSPRVLVERHEQSMACVRVFMRNNDGRTEVSKIDEPIERVLSAIS